MDRCETSVITRPIHLGCRVSLRFAAFSGSVGDLQGILRGQNYSIIPLVPLFFFEVFSHELGISFL